LVNWNGLGYAGPGHCNRSTMQEDIDVSRPPLPTVRAE
jgi:hypothetical protein